MFLSYGIPHSQSFSTLFIITETIAIRFVAVQHIFTFFIILILVHTCKIIYAKDELKQRGE